MIVLRFFAEVVALVADGLDVLGGGFWAIAGTLALAAILMIFKKLKTVVLPSGVATTLNLRNWGAGVAILALITGFMVATGLATYAGEKPRARSKCPGVGQLWSDPPFRQGKECTQAALADNSFDLDLQMGWQRPGFPADPGWRDGVDIYADATKLTAGRNVRMVFSNDDLASYADCVDNDGPWSQHEKLLEDLRREKIHSICLVTNEGRRAMLKINGEPAATGPIMVSVVVWTLRADSPP